MQPCGCEQGCCKESATHAGSSTALRELPPLRFCAGCTREGFKLPIDDTQRGLMARLMQALCEHCYRRSYGTAGG